MAEVTYKPWTQDGMVGYEVLVDGKRNGYVYFNPSTNEPPEGANVFVYSGPNGDPGLDTPLTWVYTVEKEETCQE